MSTQLSKVYACYVWKNWEIWLQNWKMDTEHNAMHVNPKHKRCMKKNLVKYLKTEIFQFWSIEHRSNANRAKQILTKNCYRNFDRSRNSFNWSKIWKNQIFEKQSILMQKLLKTHSFMNEMHEYEIKFFSKTLEFNPDLPKTRFSNNLSSNLKL